MPQKSSYSGCTHIHTLSDISPTAGFTMCSKLTAHNNPCTPCCHRSLSLVSPAAVPFSPYFSPLAPVIPTLAALYHFYPKRLFLILSYFQSFLFSSSLVHTTVIITPTAISSILMQFNHRLQLNTAPHRMHCSPLSTQCLP